MRGSIPKGSGGLDSGGWFWRGAGEWGDLVKVLVGWGGLDSGGWFWRGAGEFGELVKVWMGLKKVGTRGQWGECSWERRAGEKVIGGLLILAAVIDR